MKGSDEVNWLMVGHTFACHDSETPDLGSRSLELFQVLDVDLPDMHRA